MKRMLWRALRAVIDMVALYCAWAIQIAASGNYAAALITAVGVGAYGMWCFYDGSRLPKRERAAQTTGGAPCR